MCTGHFVLAHSFAVTLSFGVCCFALTTPGAAGPVPFVEWSRQIGTSASDQSADIASDSLGNVFAVGNTTGALSNSAGQADAFVTKLDPTGNMLWVAQFGSTAADRAEGVSVDANGSAYIVGHTAGSLSGPNLGSNDGFLAKLDSAGNHIWTRQFGGAFQDFARAVSVDVAGNVYVVGESYGSSQASSANAFLRKYSSAGTLQWSRTLASSGWDASFGVSADALGNIFVSGATGGSLSGNSAGENDIFLARFDSSGNQHWVRQFGTNANDGSQGVAADNLGNAYIVGSTSGLLGVEGGGLADAFVAKFDLSGNQLWLNQFGTNQFDYGFDISANAYGVVVVGETDDNIINVGSELSEAFVSKLEVDGQLSWSMSVGGIGDDAGHGVSLDGQGRIYISGFTSSGLGGTHVGGFDAFVVRIGEIPEPPCVILGSSAVLAICSYRRRSLQQR